MSGALKNPMISGHDTGAKGIGYRLFDPLGLTKDWTNDVKYSQPVTMNSRDQAMQYEQNRTRYRGSLALG